MVIFDLYVLRCSGSRGEVVESLTLLTGDQWNLAESKNMGKKVNSRIMDSSLPFLQIGRFFSFPPSKGGFGAMIFGFFTIQDRKMGLWSRAKKNSWKCGQTIKDGLAHYCFS